jgi:hypothetical protein
MAVLFATRDVNATAAFRRTWIVQASDSIASLFVDTPQRQLNQLFRMTRGAFASRSAKRNLERTLGNQDTSTNPDD